MTTSVSQPERNPLTVEDIREIAKTHGTLFAEKCLIEDERRFGLERMDEVRAELITIVNLKDFA
jgi:hypothetical protein